LVEYLLMNLGLLGSLLKRQDGIKMHFPVFWRKILLACLLATLFIQAGLIYIDPTGRKIKALSPAAQEGHRIWLDNNCQSCHQIYGFGGFLGPDLTNAITYLSDQRLHDVLTSGSQQMPSYHMRSKDIASLKAFLTELDKTGLSQPTLEEESPIEIFNKINEQIKREKGITVSAAKGWKFARDYACISCHLPNAQSLFQAPDLTLIYERLELRSLEAVLRQGRPTKGMPNFQLNALQIENLIDYLKWLHINRVSFRTASVLDRMSIREIYQKITWFEHRR
jgi:nitric oxide reductase subunit C